MEFVPAQMRVAEATGQNPEKTLERKETAAGAVPLR